jgi:hypothetical protein
MLEAYCFFRKNALFVAICMRQYHFKRTTGLLRWERGERMCEPDQHATLRRYAMNPRESSKMIGLHAEAVLGQWAREVSGGDRLFAAARVERCVFDDGRQQEHTKARH